MNDYVTAIGLDVHARSIKACALEPHVREVERASFGYDPVAVAEWALSFEAPRAVYESGVTGFHLCRALRALGLGCVVGAVSRAAARGGPGQEDRPARRGVPRAPARHRNVAEVWVPDDRTEAARDLSRALADARDDLQRVSGGCQVPCSGTGTCSTRRRRRAGAGAAGQRAYWEWADAISFAEPDDAAAYEGTTATACGAARRPATRWRGGWQGPPAVRSGSRPSTRSRCVKGIDVATAFLLACEAGDFSRFRTAPEFASWCGLAPSEHSSGETSSRGDHARG